MTNGQDTWSARCVETRTPGAAGGPGKRTGRKASTAPRSDPNHRPTHHAIPGRLRPLTPWNRRRRDRLDADAARDALARYGDVAEFSRAGEEPGLRATAEASSLTVFAYVDGGGCVDAIEISRPTDDR